MTITSSAEISLHHSQSTPLRLHRVKFSIKLQMSFEAELIEFSLELGTNDVVTRDRCVVVSPELFVRVTELVAGDFAHDIAV